MHRICLRSRCAANDLCRRQLSVSSVGNSKWNPVMHERHVDLGRHVYETFTVSALIQYYPDWNAAQLDGFLQGLKKSDHILKGIRSLDDFDTDEDTSDVFARFGELRLKNENDRLNELLGRVYESFVSQAAEHDVQDLIKSQHPKYILNEIVNKRGGNLYVTLTEVSVNEYQAIVHYEERNIGKSVSATRDEAERLACLQALHGTFLDDFQTFELDMMNCSSEESIDLELRSPKQRQVILKKTKSEEFGFSIRGGERKAVRNKEYIQQHLITPIFISTVKADSPAEMCGLTVGDVLLGVNDHSLEESTHKQAVTSLKKFLVSEEVLFTVKHSMKELLKYEAQQRYLERERDKLREELASKTFKEWHDAKAKQDPEQYLLEKLEDRRRPFKPKKARQSIRLWDY